MSKRARTRAPDETRQKILFAAFEEIHRNGFQATSLDTIAARAEVTKGALYHHFPEKAALGYAVVEEVVREPLLDAYLEPLRQAFGRDRAGPAAGQVAEPSSAAVSDPAGQVEESAAAAGSDVASGTAPDPIRALQEALRRRADDFEDGGIELGCPLNNLAQEMSPLDEDFRARVAAVIDAWTDELADGLARAQSRGLLRPDAEPRRVASFMVAAIEGSFGMAKNAMSVELLRSNLETLADYLDTLRVTPI